MATYGFILCIITAAMGVALLVTNRGNALTDILTTACTLLAAMYAGFYFAMMTGW